MADVNVLRKLMNPWVFGLQKLGFELKCPLCLNLLDKPVLLPCNHHFCSNCVPAETRCVVCRTQYDLGGMRPAPYMDNIVALYKMLDTTLSSTINQSLSSLSEQSPVSALRTALRNAEITNGKGSTAEPRPSLSSCDAYVAGLSDKGDKGAVSNFNEVAACVGSETEETYMKQAPVLSPESSPSCVGQTRSIIANNANQSSSDMLVKCTAKRSAECLLDEGKDGITPVSTKRQQIASNCFTDGHTEKKVICASNGVISQSRLEPAKEEHIPILPLENASNSSNLAGSVCSFCHSSKITEGSGTMLHFANGKEVKEDLTLPPNAIAVHSRCVEWTPQVYFEGDTIRNLESELKRASKLKCTKCGLKGAGLGCYLKSCNKSFHVPCAFDIEGCRWNCEKYLVLCPQHTRIKFEGEKSKPRSKKVPTGLKHPLRTDSLPVDSTESAFWKSSPHGRQEWVFCGSALSSDEKYSLAKFADMCGATCSNLWTPTVTHIIAATNEKGACARTFKYLMGILNGRWILNMGWIEVCLEAKKYVNEEPYEIVSDVYGYPDGPKTGRLRLLNNEPKVFDGLKFYFSGDFGPKYMLDLLKLVRTAGGVVIESLDTLKQSADTPITDMVVVYNYESSPCPDEDNKAVMKRLAEAQSIAEPLNSPVVKYTWLLECISAGKRFPYAS